MSIWGKAPTVPIETKICMAGNLADVITCAKFQDEIFRVYDFTGGRISHFPIDFCMGLTTAQRDCAACDKSIITGMMSNNVHLLITCSTVVLQCYRRQAIPMEQAPPRTPLRELTALPQTP